MNRARKDMPANEQISASLEDYLEAIHLIEKQQGSVRSKEIREHLQVSGPSVTEALQLLAEKGFVNYTPYEKVTLTEKGKSIAKDVLHRHETLRDFFIEVLGIDPKIADEGACKMEHAASPVIIERVIKYTHYLRNDCRAEGCDRSQDFQKYLQQVEN